MSRFMKQQIHAVDEMVFVGEGKPEDVGRQEDQE